MVKKPRLFIALCTLPALILTIVFMIVPMVNAIYLSFTSSTALSVGFNSKFVFLDNYKYMFQDKDFLQALFNTLKLMLVIPAVTIFLSLVFAFILTQGQLKEKSFYRTVFFFPSIVSMTVVGIVWSFVFNPTRGILNHMLDLFHLSTWKHAWLGEGKTALWCIGAALVWQAIGYYMVMHVASIDGISQEVYEAASIDGANRFKQMIHITLPGILPIVLLMSAINVSNILNAGFDQIFNLYNPVVYETGDIIDTYVYRAGLLDMQFSFATAVGLLKSVVGCILLISCNQMAKKFTDQKIF